MKCQILFSNNNINLSSAELAQRVVKINCTFHMYFEDTIFLSLQIRVLVKRYYLLFMHMHPVYSVEFASLRRFQGIPLICVLVQK